MSIESEFDLDKLFLPSWAQESPSFNKYAGHTGEDRRERGRGPRRDDRGERRGPPREGGRPPGERRQFGDRPPRRDGAPPFGGGRGRGGPRRDDRRGGGGFERREPAPLPEISVSLLPDEKGVESLAKQIKMTGRSYPLFEIAKIILQKPERQQVKFDVIRKDDKVVQPLFLCMLDDTLWLSEQEAVNHVLDRHFDTFYKAEKTATEPPKGVFTFVAQCGMSGTVLGPPNYHDYQNKLRRLHQERFSRMPFDMFKARVKIVKDEAVVKKWIDDQSWKTEFTTLNVPEADVKNLQTREEVEKHFRETHAANIIKEVESHTLSGQASRGIRCLPLQSLVRRAWEEQQKFPLKVVNHLSGQFAQRGLQFFKVNKFVTHVSVARPHYLDLEATPVSETIRKIVEFINTHPKCTRRDLIEAVAPTPAAAGEASAEKPAQPAAQEPTAEQNAVIADLHWLVHQGHVIEFANGTLETAKKPKPRPEPKKQEPALPGATETAVPNESVETIEPKVAELEAVRPEEAAVTTEVESAPGQGQPEFSAAEIADLQQSAEENLADASEATEEKPAATPAQNA